MNTFWIENFRLQTISIHPLCPLWIFQSVLLLCVCVCMMDFEANFLQDSNSDLQIKSNQINSVNPGLCFCFVFCFFLDIAHVCVYVWVCDFLFRITKLYSFCFRFYCLLLLLLFLLSVVVVDKSNWNAKTKTKTNQFPSFCNNNYIFFWPNFIDLIIIIIIVFDRSKNISSFFAIILWDYLIDDLV